MLEPKITENNTLNYYITFKDLLNMKNFKTYLNDIYDLDLVIIKNN